jgi:hypothetical protein
MSTFMVLKCYLVMKDVKKGVGERENLQGLDGWVATEITLSKL